MSDTILEEDHPRTMPPKFGKTWPSGLRGEDFFVTVDGWMTDDGHKVIRKLTWPFRPGELKRFMISMVLQLLQFEP